MVLDLKRFYQASNPSKTLDLGKAEDQKYYIDFSSALGSNPIKELERSISKISPNEPTCQLFTGHIGCGKSTELLRLKAELEQQGFHVVYFESSQDLDMADADISDILLMIAHQVSKSLEEVKVKLKAKGFKNLLQEAAKLFQGQIELSAEAAIPGMGNVGVSMEDREFSLSIGIRKITAKAKDSKEARDILRQYLEPRVNGILKAINQELIEPAKQQLKQQGKQGLVVIIDNLDRLENTQNLWRRTQPEYLFVDRGEQLNKFNCHVVYTIPRYLAFSDDWGRLTNRFGINPKLLPMVQVKQSDGSICEKGIALLQQMVMARAFPDEEPQQRFNLISEVFDSPDTLDRLCLVSGGHVRNLLVLLYRCLQRDDPPISRDCLESVITQRHNEINLVISSSEWKRLGQVATQKTVIGDKEYQTLLHGLFLFEYRDHEGYWFDINPILAEAKELADVISELKKEQELLNKNKSLAKAEQFLKYTGAQTSNNENLLQVTSIPGRLNTYAPLLVMFTEEPVDYDVIKLAQHSEKLANNRQQQAGIILYREQPDTLFRMRMAEVRLRDHFVLIPIPFAAVEQALIDKYSSTGLLAQYAERYLPGADLFDDRNAIGDTLSFFGRGNLLHSLEENLRRIQGIGLFGLRKSGKTSVLLQLGFAMRQHPVVHIDLQPYGGKVLYGAELFNRIIQELSKLLKKRNSKSIPSCKTFKYDCPAANLTTDFSKYFCDFAKILSQAGYQLPVLLFLDEIERIIPTEVDSRERAEEFNAFFGVLRALSQEKRLLSLLIADVHPDCNRINQWQQVGVPTNPVYSFFKEVFVFPFSQNETTEMLTEIGKLMGVEFDEDTLASIHQESGGHPFIARQMASLLCKKLDGDNKDKVKLIKFSVAKRYLNRPFKHSGILKDYFGQNIWADLQKRNFTTAIAILQLLACNEESAEGVREEVLLDKLSNDFSESECTDAILWLEAVGLAVRQELEDDDSYRIQVLLMSRWLRMQMKPEEIRQWQIG